MQPVRIHTAPIVASAALVAAALAVAASPTSAQDYSVIIKEGDTIAGIGNVTMVNGVQTNNSGQVFYEVDTDADTTRDVVVLLDGTVLYQQGTTPLAGYTFDFIDDFVIDNAGNIVFNATLDGTPGGNSDDTGIFYNGSRIIAEGSAFTATGAPANSVYTGYFGVKANDSGQLLYRASVNENGSGTFSHLIISDTSGSNQTILAAEGSTLPGLGGEIINDIETDYDEWTINNSGQAIFGIDVGDDPARQGAVYLTGTGLLAREGEASLVAGLNWGNLASPEVDLNNNGDWVMVANLDTGSTANDYAIFHNGALVAREGDVAPGMGGRLFQTLSSAPVVLDDNNNLLWVADLDGDTADDRVLFYNDTVLLQEGVSVIDGLLVQQIETLDQHLSISDNGQYVMLDVQLEGGLQTAVLITIPEPGMVGLLAMAPLAMLRRRRR